MIYRICKVCSVEKKETDFYKTGKYLRYICRKCENKKTVIYKKRRRLSLKEKAVKYLGGKCAKCGYKKCLSALEFDHIYGKEKEISKLLDSTMVWNKLKLELDKCKLMCSNCHRERHAGVK